MKPLGASPWDFAITIHLPLRSFTDLPFILSHIPGLAFFSRQTSVTFWGHWSHQDVLPLFSLLKLLPVSVHWAVMLLFGSWVCFWKESPSRLHLLYCRSYHSTLLSAHAGSVWDETKCEAALQLLRGVQCTEPGQSKPHKHIPKCI